MLVGHDDVAMDVERFSNQFNDLHDNVELIDNQDGFCRVPDEPTLKRVEIWQSCLNLATRAGLMWWSDAPVRVLANDQRWR